MKWLLPEPDEPDRNAARLPGADRLADQGERSIERRLQVPAATLRDLSSDPDSLGSWAAMIADLTLDHARSGPTVDHNLGNA